MLLIGITGGVGAGKSEILKYIKEHYRCRIYMADDIAHLVKQPGEECYDALLELLGRDIVDGTGQINKKKMAELIFSDDELLSKVNAIVHPAVKKYILERISEAEADGDAELFFVEAALLIEAGYRSILDEIWYIYADEASRRKRLSDSRGYSDEKIDGILGSQLSDETFRENCDFVIDNSRTLEDSFKQINKRLEAYTWQK
jgi:dephospho-CoA kinase